jgi:hypothetical protein
MEDGLEHARREDLGKFQKLLQLEMEYRLDVCSGGFGYGD